MRGGALILVVEPATGDARLVRAVLVPKGFAVATVDSLGEARAWLSCHSPDLLLVDECLSDGDALDFVRELKDDPSTSGVPVVFMVAGVMAIEQGTAFDTVITKPINLAGLIGAVERLMAIGKRAQRASSTVEEQL